MVRYYVVSALFGRNDAGARSVFEVARNDPDPGVRELAADAASVSAI
jgi:hypothetical protein